MSERVVVRESRGYRSSAPGTRSPLTTEVMVLDSAYCYQLVWSSLTTMMRVQRWARGRKSGSYGATALYWPLARRRAYAAKLAERLNREYG